MQALADATVPADRPADWTHAVMDVGARFCRPTRPACERCPARPWCLFAGSTLARPEPRARRGRPTEPAFATTSRWLRGRILDRLREAEGDGWVRLDGAIGDHGAEVVHAAARGLAAEGLLELDLLDPSRARLPTA
jgi:A/G-specific adenine glycosylase